MTSLDPDPGSLLDAPSPAVLTTYRSDGTAVSSPVWFRTVDGSLEVVIADGDVKLNHLERRPLCSLLVFETEPPFRGLRVEGEPTLRHRGVSQTRQAIAERYLGLEAGHRFTTSRGPGVVLQMSLDNARSWDLRGILPP